MKIGTKSVLFGAHQFLLHPLFVAAAWWRLYGFPWDPRLWVAFFVHDLGYWGKPNMDGVEGEEHPTLGAKIMGRLFDPVQGDVTRYAAECLCIEAGLLQESHTIDGEWKLNDDADKEAYAIHCDYYMTAAELLALTEWHDFTLYHSRFMAKKQGKPFSRLCVADKLATVLMPTWWYLFVTNLSGEIHEYMDVAHHREGGKYSHEIRVLGSQREWFQSMCVYMSAWIEEHRDGRLDTWTPTPDDCDRCEGCQAPATTGDTEGTPLCADCASEGKIEVCEHTDEYITDDDVITVAGWLPSVPNNDIRKVIRFGLATGRGHAAISETLAREIAEVWMS